MSYESNPVGQLEEMGHASGSCPRYQEALVRVQNEKVIFTTGVIYGNKRTWGVGTTKRLSKNAAARTLLSMIKREEVEKKKREEVLMKHGDIDQDISINMDTESGEEKNISGGVVDKNISDGGVLVDKDKPSSSSGIVSFSGDWLCHFFKIGFLFQERMKMRLSL